MKKNGFANSFRILAITLVALAVFTPKKYSQTAMAIAMALWLIIMIGGFLIRKLKSRKTNPRSHKPVRRIPLRNHPLPSAPIAEELPTPSPEIGRAHV